jgi:hypothetical protein
MLHPQDAAEGNHSTQSLVTKIAAICEQSYLNAGNTVSQTTQPGQGREWNKESETDTPQSEVRQPYRSREKDSTTPFIDSLETDHPVNRAGNPED